MSTPTLPQGPAPVSITIAGQQHQVKFTTNVLRDWSKLAKRPIGEFGLAIVQDHIEAFSGIITCALHRFAPDLNYTQEQAVDLLDEMEQAEADAIAAAIAQATTKPSQLLIAISKQVEKIHQENGTESLGMNDLRSEGKRIVDLVRAEEYRSAVTEK